MKTIYVSPRGNDQWSGSLADPSADRQDGPFATPERALQVLRETRQAREPAEVRLRGGLYSLLQPLVFGPELSGTKSAPVRFSAYPGEQPVLSGGRKIGNWQIGEHQGRRLWVADLPEAAAGDWNFLQLFVNGQRRFRPRLPRTGFHRFAALTDKDTGMNWHQGPDNVQFEPGQIRNWRNLQDVEVVVYQLWFDTHHRIRSIDEEKNIVHFQARSLGSLKDEQNQMARFYVENVFEAFEEPGQWYLDRPAGKLFYLPMEGETPETTDIVAPYLQTLVQIGVPGGKPVRHVHLENLRFQHAEWLPPAGWCGSIQAGFDIPGAVVFGSAEHCALYGCEIRNIAQYAVQLGAGSHDCRVVACAMSDMGAGGVRVDHEWCANSWETNRAKSLPTGNGKPRAALVSDCVIHDGSVLYPSAIGIWIGNAGHSRILHNHIFNMNYTAISCGWTWGYAETATVANRIEHNHIHHINWTQVLSDNGGIYLLGRQPGGLVKGNHIHHISCYGYGGWGLYPDEGCSEIVFEKNLVHHTRHAAYSGHYGRDLLVRNNIFAYSGEPHVLPAGRHEGHRAGVFERNIIVFREGRMNGAGYGAQGWPRKICQFRDNLIWAHADELDLGEPLSALREQGQFVNTVVADPLFLDPDGGDFSLRSDSPALALGFRPFAPNQAGPRQAASRPESYEDWPRERGALRPIVTSRLEIDGDNGVCLKMTNLGDASATGKVTVKPLESGTVTIDGDATLEIAELVPGATLEHRWRIQVAAAVEAFGLETEVEGVGFLPTLAYRRINGSWRVPMLTAVNEAAAVPAALAVMAPRQLRKGKALHADVRLGRTETHLLLALEIADCEIKPEPSQPWAGSCVEVFVASAQPAEPKLQFFLVPDPAAGALRIFRIAQYAVVPMSEADGVLRLEANGYACAARIPLDQLPVQAADMRMELRVIGSPERDKPRAATSIFGCGTPAYSTADYGVVQFEAPDGGVGHDARG
jgi:hypothetical protein